MSLQLTLVSNGEPVGTLHVTQDGVEQRIVYRVDDNGRGARLDERLRLVDGVPALWEVTGTSLMGGAVHERLEVAAGVARWSSQADEDEAAAGAFYLPADSSPYALALVVARARETGAPVALLPDGEVTVATFDLGTFAGRPITASSITGAQLRAQYVLHDEAAGEVVGIEDGGSLLVAADLVEVAADIDAALQTATEDGYVRISQEATVADGGPIIIRDVRVFDSADGTVGEPVSVLVEDGRIARVGAGVEVPGGATIVEGAGRVALPGLHDMHAHLNPSSALLYIAAGVTNVRDMGNHNDALAALMARIDSGELAGPSAVPAGFIEGRSEHSARMGFVVDSLDAALEAVDRYAERGFHAIKIYNSFTPAWVAPTAERAHEHGMRVQGHIPAFMDADRAIADGYDEITHLNQLALGWVLEPDEDTRTPLRLTGLTRIADLDLDGERVQSTIRTMAEQGISLDVTLVIIEQLMLSRARTVIPAHEPIIEHLPAGLRRYRKRTYVPYRDEEELAMYERAFGALQDIVVRLHEAGVRLWPGTDDGTGMTVHRELELFVDAGIAAADTLRIATAGCAEHLHRGDERGAIEPGRTADLLLVDGDPTRRIRDIRNVALVVTGERVLSPERIYRGVGVVPFVPEAEVHPA